MTTQTLTLRPTTLISAGTGATATGGTINAVLADSSDATFVDFAGGCRNSNQVAKLGFGVPSLPAGAQIESVTLRERRLTVIGTTSPPQCYHGFCGTPLPVVGFVLTVILDILRLFFYHPHPRTPVAVITTDVVASSKTDQNGLPWTAASFTNFFVEIGRTDVLPATRRVYELYLDVNYNVAATLTATGPTSPQTATATPAVTWTYTNNTDGLPQKKSWVVVYTAAQVAAVGFVPFVSTPTASSGWVLGEQLLWIIDVPLVNGSYTAYVQAAQTWDGPTDFFTATGSITWTQSIATCPNATLSSAVWNASTNTVDLTAVPSSSSPVTTYFRYEASYNGKPYQAVYGASKVPANGMTPVLVTDGKAPGNLPTIYRVLSFGTAGGVQQPAAGYSNTITVTPPVGRKWWLKDLLNPLGNTLLPVAYAGDSVTQSKNYGVAMVLGADADTVYPVVIENGRFGLEGTLTLIFKVTDVVDMWPAFDALDEIGRTLILCYPTGEQRYIRLVPGENGQAKAWDWELSADGLDAQYRKVTVSYCEVAEQMDPAA